MHLLFREAHSLDEIDTAVDLGQSPADMVFLSFADTDLAAATAACRAQGGTLPTLRLANIGKLRHPLSVDVYVEEVIAKARIVVARLLGGLEYWRYGIEEIARICADSEILLALIPGDGRPDPAAGRTVDRRAGGPSTPRSLLCRRRTAQCRPGPGADGASRRSGAGAAGPTSARSRPSANMSWPQARSRIRLWRSSCSTGPIFWPAISRH